MWSTVRGVIQWGGGGWTGVLVRIDDVFLVENHASLNIPPSTSSSPSPPTVNATLYLTCIIHKDKCS